MPKIGFTGYTLSNLNIPNNLNSWETKSIGYPKRIKTSLDIILEAPIGAASYNNEFGRPNIFGYFRKILPKNINKFINLKNDKFHKDLAVLIAKSIASTSPEITTCPGAFKFAGTTIPD